MDNLLSIANGRKISLDRIPHPDFAGFRQTVLAFASTGNIVQFFGYEQEGEVKILAILRKGTGLYAVGSTLPAEYDAFSAENLKFHMFERELAEQFGIRPIGHPWLKPVRYHANWRDVPDVFGNDYAEDIPGRYEYFQVHGEEVHEVAVGPVHAGIIEPGHFRFQCIGERVLHLEIQHGFQHRGVEKLLSSVPFGRLPIIVEGIAGDTAVGNSLCFSQAVEALAASSCDVGASRLRTLALELERLANHVGDLGALSGDVAFNPPAAYLGRLRGEFLNLLLLLAGNRFGKGLVRPGGVTRRPERNTIDLLRHKIQELRPQIEQVDDLIFTAHTVLARFEGCGVVDGQTAESLGMVGVAGRASGLDYDARRDLPTEQYGSLPACDHTRTKGDVFARAWVRHEEIMHSFALIEHLLESQTVVEPWVDTGTELAPDSVVVTVNEAWRGELSHCVLTDSAGRILRYKVKDPSFHNWTGLAMALRDEGISDFPVNNKSFNLSYCGFDL